MYNPNHQPPRAVDPFTLIADYRLNDWMEQAARARMRKAARGVADDPLFAVFANVAHAGLVEGTSPGPREAALPPHRSTEEQAQPARQRSAGSFWALLQRVIGGITRTVTGTSAVSK